MVNGGFEETNATRTAFAGWEHLRGYKGQAWNGKAARDESEQHGGAASLRLENATGSDIVQVSQNVMVAERGFTAGRKYRLSAWMKTGHMAQANAIGLAFSLSNSEFKGAGRIALPTTAAGWTRGSTEFTVPAGAAFLRIMVHVSGKAMVWVDDVTLEEVRADGTTTPAMLSPLPPDHELMRRWVELYHSEGRPWLQFGRMLHPPKLACATIKHRERPMPAVLHNAFLASDGREAVVLANATREKQTATLVWKGQESRWDLPPGGVALVK